VCSAGFSIAPSQTTGETQNLHVGDLGMQMHTCHGEPSNLDLALSEKQTCNGHMYWHFCISFIAICVGFSICITTDQAECPCLQIHEHLCMWSHATFDRAYILCIATGMQTITLAAVLLRMHVPNMKWVWQPPTSVAVLA